MTIIILILGVLALTLSLVFKNKYSKKAMNSLLAFGIAFIVLSQSIVIIPTNHTGVKTAFGQISSDVLNNGLSFKTPLVDKIKVIDNRQIDKKFKNKIAGEANDKTVVFAENILVTYQLNPDMSVYLYKNLADLKEIVSSSVVESAIRESLFTLDADSVTNRGKIEPIAKDMLQNQLSQKYGDNVVTIIKVTIESMDYEDAYNEAIAKKQETKIIAEQQKIENEKNIEKARSEIQVAEQEKQKAIINKEIQIINAEAWAEDARIKSEAITPELLAKWELDARQKHGWVTIQGGTPVVDTRE